MEFNVYDFDGTIYQGDVTKDFYGFVLQRYPIIVVELPRFLLFGLLYWLRLVSKKTLKENFFRFLRYIYTVDELVKDFWKYNLGKIQKHYYERKTNQDVIISASPDFLLLPLQDLLGIYKVIATKVDQKTGKFRSENCQGKEKVRRFLHELPGATIGCFYSDNTSDRPLSKIAKVSFYVRGSSIMPWKDTFFQNNKEQRQDA